MANRSVFQTQGCLFLGQDVCGLDTSLSCAYCSNQQQTVVTSVEVSSKEPFDDSGLPWWNEGRLSTDSQS